MTTLESLAVLRLRQWAYERTKAQAGRTTTYSNRGWTERRNRMADARLVRVMDFERAFALIPEEARTLLLLSYRDGYSVDTIAQLVHCSARTVFYHLPQARQTLAITLDRLGLL